MNEVTKHKRVYSTPTDIRFLQFTRYNIAARNSQYISLLIGIVLTVIFISVSVFLVSSIPVSINATFHKRFGYADVVVPDTSREDMQRMQEEGKVENVGLVKVIGYAKTEQEKLISQFALAATDEAAYKYLDYRLLEGRLPEKAGEIALELSCFNILGADYNVGQSIQIPVFMPVEKGASQQNVEKRDFVLVGILENKNINIWTQANYGSEVQEGKLPFAWVTEDEPIASLGVPDFVAYAKGNEDVLKKLENGFYFDNADAFGVDTFIIRMNYGVCGNNNEQSIIMLTLFITFLVVCFLFAALLSVHNSMRSVMDGKIRQMALMRAVGASKSQLITLAGKEAFLLTLVTIP